MADFTELTLTSTAILRKCVSDTTEMCWGIGSMVSSISGKNVDLALGQLD